MQRETLVEMKYVPKNSNPAKNEVIEATKDNVLKTYLS